MGILEHEGNVENTSRRRCLVIVVRVLFTYQAFPFNERYTSWQGAED